MKRTVIALTVTALAVGGAGMASAKPGNGNGAVKTALASTDDAMVLNGQCAKVEEPAGKQAPNGFVVLNAPGKPAKGQQQAQTRNLVGEVALKNAAPNTTYDVHLATSGCGERIGDLTTNGQGNGNLAFQDATKGAGTYYVVLIQKPLGGLPVLEDLLVQQSYASAPATVK